MFLNTNNTINKYQYADQVFKEFIRKPFRSMLGRLVSYSMKSRVWIRGADKKCEKRRNISDSNFRPNSECSWRKKKP